MTIEKYVHHGREVAVCSELRGKHREHCLCYACGAFYAEPKCPIASALYAFDCTHGVTTPVWECASWGPVQSSTGG